MIKRVGRNTTGGRDIIVGDIHGNFSAINDCMDEIEFDTAKDRMFSVGDIVDRGSESDQALRWLGMPWFHAVLGNHEGMAEMFCAGELSAGDYAQNGGAWLIGTMALSRNQFADAFRELPLVIELETAEGQVGIVHAACDFPSWGGLLDAIRREDDAQIENAVWGRERIGGKNFGPVAGVRAVVVGHTPVKEVTVIDNVHHIDTGGWLSNNRGHFTLLDAATLKPATRP